jgi:Zn-dependent metalloprotease
MKYINTLGFLILSMMVYSQTSLYKKHAVFYMPTESKFLTIKNFQKFISTENTNLFLESNYLNNRFSGQKLELESIKKSPLGFHYRYKHIYKGLPVFQSFVQANYDNSGNLILVIDNLAQFDDLDIPETPSGKGKFWMNTNYGLTPAYRMEIWDSSKNQSAQYYYNNEDKLLLVNDPRLYFNNPDSIVSAMVYLPNPIVAANATYGDKGFVDNNKKKISEHRGSLRKIKVLLGP